MKKLSSMIKSKKPLVIPGVYDAIGAKIAEKVGFDAMFQTGYGTSATLFGMPDYGFIGATETVDNARRISNAISVPLIVDSDTGYGNALSVWKLFNPNLPPSALRSRPSPSSYARSKTRRKTRTVRRLRLAPRTMDSTENRK